MSILEENPKGKKIILLLCWKAELHARCVLPWIEMLGWSGKEPSQDFWFTAAEVSSAWSVLDVIEYYNARKLYHFDNWLSSAMINMSGHDNCCFPFEWVYDRLSNIMLWVPEQSSYYQSFTVNRTLLGVFSYRIYSSFLEKKAWKCPVHVQ